MLRNKYFKNHYPRPQFVRESFFSLDGKWDFLFDDENRGMEKKYFQGFSSSQKIVVPFSYQTPLSEIGDTTPHSVIWYQREIHFDQIDSKRVILNFEGSDYETKVWVNGVYLGVHEGGYCRFSFDITDALKKGSGVIVIRVEDRYDCTQPRGKQKWLKEPFGCWYLETNGLWKSVWCELVSSSHLKRVKMTPVESNYYVDFECEVENFRPRLSLKTEVFYHGEVIASSLQELTRNHQKYAIDFSNDLEGFKIHWWTPENPNLYDVCFTLFDENMQIIDEVGSYVGFRIFKTVGNCLMLNLNPVYLRMTLEQEYYKDGGLTPKDDDTIIRELKLIQSMGFNGIRVHQKIADERFYYYCDLLGLFAWCEMPSSYEFRDVTIEKVTKEWMEVVKQNYNHPSIICWVPINESWGVNRLTSNRQEASFTQALYYLTKSYDSMRPVISNDGWEHTKSDIVTFHNYGAYGKDLLDFYQNMKEVLEGKSRPDYSQLRRPFVEGFHYEGQPILIDEFAGIGYQVEDEGWGYGNQVESEKAYLERLNSLVQAIRSLQDVSGFCVTQTTDVYQEINGMLTMDRKAKVDIQKLCAIIKQ